MERGSRDDDRQLAAGHHGRPPCSILGADAPSAPTPGAQNSPACLRDQGPPAHRFFAGRSSPIPPGSATITRLPAPLLGRRPAACSEVHVEVIYGDGARAANIVNVYTASR